MNLLKSLQTGKSSLPSVINDPFSANMITDMRVRYGRKLFGDGEWEARGTIEFTNGATKGEQNFIAPTWDECVTQMKACIEQLQKEKK